MPAPSKPSFEDFLKTCTPFLKNPALEAKMRERVRDIIFRLRRFKPGGGAIEEVKRFLREDKNFFGVMLALSGLAQEKLLRVLTAERFSLGDFGGEWRATQVKNKIKKDDAFADKIARMLWEGRNNALLTEHIADFYLDRLSLADDWTKMIRNETIVDRLVREQLTGEYTDMKGEFIEDKIRAVLDRVKKTSGIPHEKGQVPLLGKEADCAIPSCADPFVIVMSSYYETTSSAQTTRANEHRQMFSKLREDNGRYPQRKPRVLVNFLDGSGWIARRSDLYKMHHDCDYCLNMKTLNQLADIVRFHAKAAK